MLSLLIFLPVSLLVLAALAILILQQSRPSIGYSWLIAAIMSLLVTGILIGLRWWLPIELILYQWRPFGEFSSPPSFRLDLNTWPYAVCLVVLAMATVFTDSARLGVEARPLGWAVGLGQTAVGLLAVMAGNPLTLVVSWTAVDLIELIVVLSSETGRRMGQQTVTSFSVRVSGQLLVILAILFARSQGIPFDLNPIPGPLAIFMLLAVGLRLGVLPINILYTREIYTSRGLGNVARSIGLASSLVVLGRMPYPVAPPDWQSLLLSLTALAALYGSAMWLTASNELNGRPYWSIALAALAIASGLNGQASASIAWGVALLLTGSVMFLYSAHRRSNPTIPLMAVIGLVGLPFTPAAHGWTGAVGSQFNLATVFFMLTVIFLIWGYIRHTFHARDELHRMERWVHAVYPTGLVFLILAQWVITLLGSPGIMTAGVWWASTSVFFLACAGAVLAYTNQALIATGANSFLASTGRRIGSWLGAFFRLNWLYGFLSWVYRIIQNVVGLLTAVFEGDGGILWSLVMLALLISLVWVSGGQP